MGTLQNAHWGNGTEQCTVREERLLERADEADAEALADARSDALEAMLWRDLSGSGEIGAAAKDRGVHRVDHQAAEQRVDLRRRGVLGRVDRPDPLRHVAEDVVLSARVRCLAGDRVRLAARVVSVPRVVRKVGGAGMRRLRHQLPLDLGRHAVAVAAVAVVPGDGGGVGAGIRHRVALGEAVATRHGVGREHDRHQVDLFDGAGGAAAAVVSRVAAHERHPLALRHLVLHSVERVRQDGRERARVAVAHGEALRPRCLHADPALRRIGAGHHGCASVTSVRLLTAVHHSTVRRRRAGVRREAHVRRVSVGLWAGVGRGGVGREAHVGTRADVDRVAPIVEARVRRRTTVGARIRQNRTRITFVGPTVDADAVGLEAGDLVLPIASDEGKEGDCRDGRGTDGLCQERRFLSLLS